MRKRFSPSMMVAIVAVFFSLGGASFAAGRLSHGVSRDVFVSGAPATAMPGQTVTASASCPRGTLLLSGGYTRSGQIAVDYDWPAPPDGWQVRFTNPQPAGGSGTEAMVYVVCGAGR